MIHNLADLIACGKLPFEQHTVRTFAGVVTDTRSVFSMQQVHDLVESDHYRHNVMSIVLNKRLVQRSEHGTVANTWNLYKRGASFLLRHLHENSSTVAAVCQIFANEFQLPTHASGYLSPPNSQGLPIHSDVDSVFAVQVAGTKAWETYRSTITDPTDPNLGQNFELDDTKPFDRLPEYTLSVRPGGVVFVSRGIPHRATTGEEQSLHVSVGLLHPEIDPKIVAEQRPVMPRG